MQWILLLPPLHRWVNWSRRSASYPAGRGLVLCQVSLPLDSLLGTRLSFLGWTWCLPHRLLCTLSFTDLLQFAHSFLRPTLPQGWYPVLCFGADPGLSTMAGIAKYLINTVCQDTFSCFKNRYICPAFSPELLGQMRVPSCLSASGHCTGRCWTDYGVFCASLVKTEAPTASGH